MKRALFGVAAVCLVGCGPKYKGQDIKSSDDWLAEQEQLAYEEEKKKRESGDDMAYAGEETDEEKRAKFDRKQAKAELKRATRSAESCPGVVKEQEGDDPPRGSATVTIHFATDGSVEDASISSPFDGTPLGNCVLNAYTKVKVPPFAGGTQIVDWELELEDAEEGE